MSEPAQPRPEKGFAKFLAARRADWGGKVPKDSNMEGPSAGIGEGVEVERHGRGVWNWIVFIEDGNGYGVADNAMDVSGQREYFTILALIMGQLKMFHCDGRELAIKRTITLPVGDAIRDVVVTHGWKDVCILTEVNH